MTHHVVMTEDISVWP